MAAASLDVAEVQKVYSEKLPSTRKKKLAKLLEFDEFDEDDDLRAAIVLDIYYNNLEFAVNQGLPWRNVCVFFDLTRGLLQGLEERSLLQSISIFKEELQSYGTHFTSDSLKSLVDFVFLTFFQHYKLYQYVMLYSRDEDRTQYDVTIEPPVATDNMMQAIPKSEWDEKQKLKEIDGMEASRRQERQTYYGQQITEAAKQLEEPYNELTSSEQPISKEQLDHIIRDVVGAQATVTETLLQETLDEMKDTLEYQHMRATVVAEYQDEPKTTHRKKSGASSSKSKRIIK